MKKAIKWSHKMHAPLAGAALALALGTIGGCNSKNGTGGTSGAPFGGRGAGDAVATVNGETIGREELHSALEAVNGESTLQQLIDYELLMQKLKSEGLEVSDAEVDKFLEARRKENPQLMDKVMTTGGPQLEELKRRVRSQLAIDKLLTKDTKVTDEQLQKWFQKNRAPYDQPERVKIGILFASTKTRADILAKQLKDKTKSFKELVDDQQKANDPAAKQSFAETPDFVPLSSLDAKTASLIKPLKAGETTAPASFGQAPQTAFGIVRLVERQPAKKADFAELKPELELLYKLEQVARAEAKQNPQGGGNYEKTVEQVKTMLGSQGPVSDRQVINYINQAAVTRLLTSIRAGAKVEIPDKTYAHIADAYKAPTPAPGGAPGGEIAPPSGAPGGAPGSAPPAPPAPPAK